jgi:hypothetical protein
VVVVIAAIAAMNVIAVRLEPKPVAVIGVQQMVVGAAVIATTAIAVG